MCLVLSVVSEQHLEGAAPPEAQGGLLLGHRLLVPTGATRDAPGRIRTSDPRIRSPPLCPLSYGRVRKRVPPHPYGNLLRFASREPESGGRCMAEKKLAGKKIAILAADMFERVELEEPRKALEDAGAETEVLSIDDGEIQGFDHFDPAKKIKVDKTVEEVSVDDYDALLIPGGVGNPDQLRGDENAVAFVRDFAASMKPMAVICHGPWVLVEAGVARGRTLTSWPTLQTDIRNAGGEWVDKEVVVDDGIVTSRKPDDIPAFNKKMIEEFCEGSHGRREVATAGMSQGS